MAEYAVFLYWPEFDDEVDVGDPKERQAAHDRHSDELTESGAMFAAFRLESAEMSTSIRGDVISDGPFLEAKEVIAGLYVMQAPDLDAAIAIARGNPILQQGGGIEVRPVQSFLVHSPGA